MMGSLRISRVINPSPEIGVDAGDVSGGGHLRLIIPAKKLTSRAPAQIRLVAPSGAAAAVQTIFSLSRLRRMGLPGPKAKSAEWHRARGTYRRDRRGLPKPAA